MSFLSDLYYVKKLHPKSKSVDENSKIFSPFFPELRLRSIKIDRDICSFLEILYMQSPRQLKVKLIDISPPDVLFPRRSENFKKHRFVATIPRFSTELLTLIMRLATGKMPTTHDNTRIKEGVYSAITSYDMLRNISKWIPNPLRKLFSTLNDFNRKRWRTCFAYCV